jgi:hypothetical protein
MIALDMFYLNLDGKVRLPQLLDMVLPTFKVVDYFGEEVIDLDSISDDNWIIYKFKVYNKDDKSYKDYSVSMDNLLIGEENIIEELNRVRKDLKSRIVKSVIE